MNLLVSRFVQCVIERQFNELHEREQARSFCVREHREQMILPIIRADMCATARCESGFFAMLVMRFHLEELL